MTVGVLEVHPAAAVVAVDFVGAVLAGVGLFLLVAAPDDGVVELHTHVRVLLS
jgi:hypothetical protein